ncbi:MAG: hypothetical protein GEU91_03355 [Rhizobiales bacterium]|nr:hypothetical protein [Hyphomicrobiales bacterium]
MSDNEKNEKANVTLKDIRIGGGPGYFNKAIVVGDNTNITGNRLFIDSAEIGIEAGNNCNVDLTNTIIRPNGKIPVKLVQAMIADLKQGKAEEELLATYGKDVQEHGIDVDKWLARGARFTDLISAAARLFGLS